MPRTAKGWEVVKVYEENDTGPLPAPATGRLCEAMLASASAWEIDAILGYSNCSFHHFQARIPGFLRTAQARIARRDRSDQS